MFGRQNLKLIIVAAACMAVGLSAPAVGHGVQHALFAHNSDKVDGRHAVGARASVDARKGKLVATSLTTGLLPDNIIGKAPNSDKLDGLDSSDLLPVGGTAANSQLLDGLGADQFVQPGDAAGGILSGTWASATIEPGAIEHGMLAPQIASTQRTLHQIVPANSAPAAISFDAFGTDTGGIFNSEQPTRLTAPVNGWYVVTGRVGWQTGAIIQDAWYSAKLQLNGAAFAYVAAADAPQRQNFSEVQWQSLSTVTYLQAGTYVELVLSQTHPSNGQAVSAGASMALLGN